MEALKNIPRVLDGVEDVRNESIEDIFKEYKRNVKIFVQTMKKEVSVLIDNYQNRINQLTQENQRLKEASSGSKQFIRTATKINQQSKEITDFSPSSSIKKTARTIDLMQTAKSNVFHGFSPQGFDEDMKFSSVLSKYKRSSDEDNHFPVELINPEPADSYQKNKSRFEDRIKRKKHREEELIHFLQTGRKSMHTTTEKFLQSVGKNKQVEEEIVLELPKEHSESSNSIKKSESGLNQSLGNICNSLDTSYVSKKARSQKQKRMGQIQDQIKRKQKQEEEMGKIMKERGIKSLLLRLRDNVENSAKRLPQVVKTSKLMVCNAKEEPKINNSSQITGKRQSKVMINPVPVDIVRKHKATQHSKKLSNDQVSPTNKPQSILKQSSNILSRSLSGISMIQFA